MNLKEIREQWEKGLEVKYKHLNYHNDMCLVILQDSKGSYHCHRYFCFGQGIEGNWEVSVDAQKAHIEQVWEWLADPKALPV